MSDKKITKKEELRTNSSPTSKDTIIKDIIITTVDADLLYQRIAFELGDQKKLFIGWDSEFNAERHELYSYQFAGYGRKGKHLKTKFEENVGYHPNMDGEKFQYLIKKVTYLSRTKEGDVYLLSHYSTAEISTINNFFSKDNFTTNDRLIDFGKYGIYEFRSDKIIFKSLRILDTLNFQKSNLAKIGEALGIPKINFQSEVEKILPRYKNEDIKAIEDFGMLLKDPLTRKLAISYGLRDSEICLKFALAIVELMKRETGKIIICETLPSATEKLFLDKYIEYPDKKIKSKDKNKPKNDKGARGESLGHEKVVYHPTDVNGYSVPYKNFYYRNRLFKQVRDMGENIYQGGRNQTYFNGIVKQTCFDFDIKGAYTVPLRLIKGLRFNVFKKDGRLFRHQTKEYTLEQFKEKLRKLNNEEILTLQGTFSGVIVYQNDLYITPTLINLKTNLAECLIDNSEHHIIELAVILKYYPETVNWEETKILRISLFNTSNKYVFRKYIEYLTEQRNKYPKGSVFNVLYKLLSNSFYGKLAQGIRGDYRGNIITDKREKMPESRIFNPLFAAYITAYIRLMTFEAVYSINNAHNQDFSEGVLNVITDGCLLTGKRSPDEYINQFNNLPFIKQTREMLGVDSLGELKHKSLNGHIVPKVRIDFPLNYEERGDIDDSDMKIAAPSGYSRDLTKKEVQRELIELYLEKPNAIIPNRRLQSYRDIFETNDLLTSILVDKIINGNLQSTKNVITGLDNEIYRGVILKSFDDINLATMSYLRNQNSKFRNVFLAYSPENTERYMLLNHKNFRLRERTEESRYAGIVNDLIYTLKKKYKLNLTYNKLIDELKSKISKINFTMIKQRVTGIKIQANNTSIEKDFKKCLNQQLEVLKEDKKLVE